MRRILSVFMATLFLLVSCGGYEGDMSEGGSSAIVGENNIATPITDSTLFAPQESFSDIPEDVHSSGTFEMDSTMMEVKADRTKLCDPTPDPTAVTATPDEICNGSSSQLNATSTGSTISWYTVATGGVAIGTSASGDDFEITPTVTTTYYAEAKLPDDIVEETFNYTGALQTWTVPADVASIKIEAWGAQGNKNSEGDANGGLGGYVEGTLSVTPGQVLNIYVGEGDGAGISGGWNGGGSGGTAGCADSVGGGGGGASDIRLGGTGLTKRILVAAGGGGAGGNRNVGCGPGSGGGGGGGYYGGGGGGAWIDNSISTAKGGTQKAGGAGGDGEHGDDGLPGSSGLGGNGGHANSGAQAGSNTAAIGGTGGGETGSNGIDAGNYTGGSGAGGSSYSGGVTDGTTTAGLRSGNGLIKITYIEKIYCISNRVAVDVTVNPLTIGGSIAGTATIIYGSSTGTMTLSGHIGTIQRWERKLNSGSWETITNTTTTHSETPTLVGTWYYRVSVKSGVCLETYSSEFTVTVNKADSTVTTWPTATAITYGQTLADSTLNSGDSTPAGSFAFTTPATAPNIGTAGHSVTFTPTDTDNYNGLTGTASVTVDPIAPTIATVVATAITTKTATSGGSISSDGGATISAKGVCYGETANPTTAGVCVPDASADTTFSVSLTGLTVATTYFYRAFATNSVSTTYGNNLSFTTLNALSITAGQTFLVDENSSALTVVGTVVITGDIQGSVIYAITAGNDAGGFAINSSTGEITVASQSVLDFEITPTFVLTISATDDENSDSETVAIDLNNLNDSDPILSDVEWSLSEVADIGTVVGTITAVDGDGDLNTISYAIIAGNDAGVFAIDSATGQVTVADNSTLDFELTTQYILTVEASDGTHATEAFATINITDENGVCGEAEVVGELPYTHTSSTTDRPSSLTAYGESCIEEEYPSPDFVYSIELETGDRIEITLDPANGFDGVLLLLGNCGEDEDCLDAINEFGIGENEVIHYEATEDETLFIVVEGVSDASGNYILTVEEWAAETPDETTDDLSDEDSESETPDETVDEANTASDDDTADSGDSADDTDSGDTGDDTGDSVNDSDELIDDDTSETDEDYPTNSNNGCGCSMVL